MSRRGSSEFVNLTLTEFLMVIIFLLIILLFYTFEQNNPAQTDVQLTPHEIARIEDSATEFNKELFHEDTSDDTTKKQIFLFIEKMNEALDNPATQAIHKKSTLPEIWNDIEAMKRESVQLKEKIHELGQAIKNLDDRKAIKNLVNEKVGLEKRLGEVQKELDKYAPLAKEFSASSPEEVVKGALTMRGRYINLVARADKQGVGNPLCWTDTKGEIEYVFSIAILENGTFRVTPIYPPYREADLRDIGYANPKRTRTLNEHEFKNQMQAFWNYGQRTNTCRFFVKVQDKTKSKERWKHGLSLVENYFYKAEIP